MRQTGSRGEPAGQGPPGVRRSQGHWVLGRSGRSKRQNSRVGKDW